MPISKESLVALGALAAWLLLGVSGWGLLTTNLEYGFQVGAVSIVPLVIGRVLVAVNAGHPLGRVFRGFIFAAWILANVAFAALVGVAVAVTAEMGLVLGVGATLGVTALGGSLAGLAWWAVDRLHDRGLDGAFVLALPEVAFVLTGWHVDSANYVIAGLISPWRALGTPLLPVLVVLVAALIRPPRPGVSVLGSWAPKTILPFLLLPAILWEVGMPLSSIWASAPILTSWIGAAAAVGLMFKAGRGERKLYWPILLFSLVPVLVASTGIILWGALIAPGPYAGAETAAWRLQYAAPPPDEDLQTIQDRIERAGLRGGVQRSGDDLRITLHGVTPGTSEWWLQRYGARQGRIEVRLRALYDRDETRRLAGPSDQPQSWPPPPPGTVWAHRRCPGSRCRPYPLRDPAVLPDNPFDEATVEFVPRTFAARVHLSTGTHTAEFRRGYRAALTLDGHVLGWVERGAIGSNGLVFDQVHPRYAQRVAETVVGPPLLAGQPVAVTQELAP